MNQPALNQPANSAAIWNVPNQLTVARLLLAIVCFVLLTLNLYGAALVVFVLAAGTDWVDGYWARRYGQITQLGRVLDPFADKIVICGTFIFLSAVPDSKILPWMAVVVVARELLVTALRSFFEERDVDFSAKWSGKWKMVFQCLAVGFSMYRLTYLSADPAVAPLAPDWLTHSTLALAWVAVLMTLYSGWGYVRTALKMMGG